MIDVSAHDPSLPAGTVLLNIITASPTGKRLYAGGSLVFVVGCERFHHLSLHKNNKKQGVANCGIGMGLHLFEILLESASIVDMSAEIHYQSINRSA